MNKEEINKVTQHLVDSANQFSSYVQKLADVLNENAKHLADKLNKIQKEKLDQTEERWKPGEGDRWYYITGPGEVEYERIWNMEYYANHYNIGNCFPTEEAAQAELMRRKAAVNKWLPKVGEGYWFWDLKNQDVNHSIWYGNCFEHTIYWFGNTHRTEEVAEKWGAEFGQYFKINQE